MDDEVQFRKLQQMIIDGDIDLEVSKTYSAAALGGPVGGFVFTILVLGVLGVFCYLLYVRRFLHALFCLIGLVVFWRLWCKFGFYYYYMRSIKDMDFFIKAYRSRMIRLENVATGEYVSHPTSWRSLVYDSSIKDDS
ncbi:MAG: hypothetical protein ACYTEL_08225 [Planctomycetota bacterium]|jgi:hypothetical protein